MGLDIQSKEVIDKISDDLKLQPSMKIPREIADKIQLVYNVNPERIVKVTKGAVSDGTASTIFTTSLVKETFMIGCSLTVAKDVVNDSLFSDVNARPFEQAGDTMLRIRYEPVTAGQFTESIFFPIAIKLRRGSVVTVNNESGLASIDTTALIYFYETDPQ